MSDKNWYDNYEENIQYYQRPTNPPGTNGRFAGAAFGCGIASLATIWTGFLSLILGGLGILFANLSKRRGVAYPAKAKKGMIMSIIGLVIGLIISAYSVYWAYSLITSGVFQQTMLETYTSVYGEELGTEMYQEVMELLGQ